ncbi:MAG: T9SS type A sorting domain-containing protein [Chitinophagaceae bacterium]
MKKLIGLCLLLCLVFVHGFSQEFKRANNWYLGAPGVFFDFNFNPVNFYQYPNLGAAASSSCVSNTSGQFQFVSTGFQLGDKVLNLMDNGDSINCPKGYKFYHDETGTGIYTQMTLILPKKGNQYYVFGVGMSDSVATNYANHTYTEFDVLNYSIVDMDSNGGKGKVIEKNILLAENQHYVNCAMQAVRHGNGKDWWLCKADCRNDKFQLYLVKEDTIEGPFYQDIHILPNDDFCSFTGTMYFSEDGTKLAYGTGKIIPNGNDSIYDFNSVKVYDFDRCKGTISYRQEYKVPFDTTTYPNKDYQFGLCFSPDSKLLYMSSIYSLHQIDIEDTNRYNAIYITGPDTVLNYFPWYGQMKIAPDGRIYIGTPNITRPYMSYIAQPNVRGLGCQFTPNGIWQPYTNLSNTPNMPCYSLGKDSCWPVSTSNLSAPQGELLVYPNPAHTWLSIACMLQEGESAQFELYDMVGNKKLEKTLTRDENTRHINISKMPQGVYIYTCKQAGHKTASGKLIIE